MLILRCDYCNKDAEIGTSFETNIVTINETVYLQGQAVDMSVRVEPQEDHICMKCAKSAIKKIKGTA